LMG
jgi:hypothetical protein